MWTDIIMDFIVRLSELKRCDSIYVVVDRLCKYAHFTPCSSSATTKVVEQLFINHAWKLHGFRGNVVTQRHPKFVGSLWRAYTTQLGINHKVTTTKYPQADDQTECTNRKLAQYVRLYTRLNPREWLDFLPRTVYAQYTTMHALTRCSPAALVCTETALGNPSLDMAVGS